MCVCPCVSGWPPAGNRGSPARHQIAVPHWALSLLANQCAPGCGEGAKRDLFLSVCFLCVFVCVCLYVLAFKEDVMDTSNIVFLSWISRSVCVCFGESCSSLLCGVNAYAESTSHLLVTLLLKCKARGFVWICVSVWWTQFFIFFFTCAQSSA